MTLLPPTSYFSLPWPGSLIAAYHVNVYIYGTLRAKQTHVLQRNSVLTVEQNNYIQKCICKMFRATNHITVLCETNNHYSKSIQTQQSWN